MFGWKNVLCHLRSLQPCVRLLYSIKLESQSLPEIWFQMPPQSVEYVQLAPLCKWDVLREWLLKWGHFRADSSSICLLCTQSRVWSSFKVLSISSKVPIRHETDLLRRSQKRRWCHFYGIVASMKGYNKFARSEPCETRFIIYILMDYTIIRGLERQNTLNSWSLLISTVFVALPCSTPQKHGSTNYHICRFCTIISQRIQYVYRSQILTALDDGFRMPGRNET